MGVSVSKNDTKTSAEAGAMTSDIEVPDNKRAKAPGGPLGPWRLSLSIAAAAVMTGMPLMRAASSGVELDLALLRSFGAAFLIWVCLSSINRVIATAAAKVDRDIAAARSN